MAFLSNMKNERMKDEKKVNSEEGVGSGSLCYSFEGFVVQRKMKNER